MAGVADAAVPITAATLRDKPLPRASGDKNASGRVLVIGGNAAMPGAVRLAAEAALRAGAGKVQIATAEPVAAALGVAVPEAYVEGLPVDARGDLDVASAPRVLELAADADAVLVGPGIMHPDSAANLARAIVPALTGAVCLDALALAFLTGALGGVRHLAGRCVLSPNPDELFETLGERAPDDGDDHDVHEDETEEQLAVAAARLASETHAVVVAGARTSFIAVPSGELWSDASGHQGLAVSGSGDVKAGIVAGLLARGADAERAALWAGHVHGRAGEHLAATVGARGLLARELLPRIPAAITELEG